MISNSFNRLLNILFRSKVSNSKISSWTPRPITSPQKSVLRPPFQDPKRSYRLTSLKSFLRLGFRMPASPSREFSTSVPCYPTKSVSALHSVARVWWTLVSLQACQTRPKSARTCRTRTKAQLSASMGALLILSSMSNRCLPALTLSHILKLRSHSALRSSRSGNWTSRCRFKSPRSQQHLQPHMVSIFLFVVLTCLP